LSTRSRCTSRGRGDATSTTNAIVDPQLRSLEVYELGRDGRYAVARAAGRGRVRVPGCPGLVLDLGKLWEEVDEAERTHARTARRRRR